jgi:hypothetical protein
MLLLIQTIFLGKYIYAYKQAAGKIVNLALS